MKKSLGFLFFLMVYSIMTWASVPAYINFQAVLYNDDDPIHGTKQVEIGLYQGTETTPYWTETQSALFTNGLVKLQIGSVEELTYDDLLVDSVRLGLIVEGESSPIFTQFVSVPYSIVAAYAESTPTASATQYGSVKLGDYLTLDENGALTVTGITEANFSEEYRSKLDGIEPLAKADQRLFGRIIGDQGYVTPDETESDLNIIGGTDISTTVSGNTVVIDYIGVYEEPSYFNQLNSDSGTYAASSPSESISILGGIGIDTSIFNNEIIIGLDRSYSEKAFGTIQGDSGEIEAESTDSTLIVRGGTDIETAVVNGVMTIAYTGDGGSNIPVWTTFSSDDGDVYADSTDDTFTIVGSNGILTSIADDVLTISSVTDVQAGSSRVTVTKTDDVYSIDVNEEDLTLSDMSGVVPLSKGGTGKTTISSGQVLIGKTDGTFSATSLTAGDGIEVVTGNGSISIAVDSAVLRSDNNLSDVDDATESRSNLGLSIGSDVQGYDTGLSSLSSLTTAADKMIYTTALDTYAVTGFTAAGRSLIDDSSTSNMLTTLIGVGSAGQILKFDGT